MSQAPAPTMAQYRWFAPLETRWMDNDVYGHVNNVTYYSYFDTAVNLYLIREGKLDIMGGETIALVVESHCTYREAVAYPDRLKVGLRVDKLGTTSVMYGLSIFRADGDAAVASGSMVHVFVDRAKRRPVPIPAGPRNALARLVVKAA